MSNEELLVVLKCMRDTAWDVRKCFEGDKKMTEHYSAVCDTLWEIIRMLENDDFAMRIKEIYLGNN